LGVFRADFRALWWRFRRMAEVPRVLRDRFVAKAKPLAAARPISNSCSVTVSDVWSAISPFLGEPCCLVKTSEVAVTSYLVLSRPGICVQVSSVFKLCELFGGVCGVFWTDGLQDGEGTPRDTHHTTSDVTHTDFSHFFPFLFCFSSAFHFDVCVVSRSARGRDI